ncbi:Long-chain-fatty-acid--CoA ligase [hydrothermal vent metagenome]|uniref:Long-chain-fatty-acid--CoA ligase n=1 Tax=hydrothermal vent metagenome TaxID=652676 RepID=A0A3B1AKL8_9ZZZZ
MTDATQDIIPPKSVGNLHNLLLERIRRSPDVLAYRCFNTEKNQWGELSWQQVADEVACWKAALAAEDLQIGDRVAVMAQNCPKWVMFEQAALSLQLVLVPLYANDRPDNIGYIIQDAGIKLILIENENHWQVLCEAYNSMQDVQRIISLKTVDSAHDVRLKNLADWLPTKSIPLEKLDVANDTLATIVYTSGTTGNPKGVMLSHANILWNADSAQRCDHFYTDDVFLSFLPLSHMFERTAGYYMPMQVGASISFSRSIEKLAEDMLYIRPTILVTVPRIFERVYNKIQLQLADKPAFARKLFDKTVDVGWQRFLISQGRASRSASQLLWPLLDALVAKKIRAKLGGRLRLAVCGGAALSNDIARTFMGLGITITQGYGMTELSPVVSTNRLDDNDPFSVGQPLPEVEARIGENGELLVRSPGIMLGYYKNEKATAEMIDEEGWLHTGDVAEIREGRIYITGRLKDIIVLSNGEKIPPADMELAISTDPLFEQAMIIGEGRSFLSAIVVINQDKWLTLARSLSLDPEDSTNLDNDKVQQILMEHIAVKLAHFPGYAKLYAIKATLEPWSIENGLITPTMKVKRSRVEDYFQDTISAFYAGH